MGGGWGWGIFINCKSWVIIKMLCGWLSLQILTYISPQTFIHSSRRNFFLEELLQIVCQNEYLQVWRSVGYHSSTYQLFECCWSLFSSFVVLEKIIPTKSNIHIMYLSPLGSFFSIYMCEWQCCCFFPFKLLCQGIITFSSKPSSVISASVVEGHSYLMTLLV